MGLSKWALTGWVDLARTVSKCRADRLRDPTGHAVSESGPDSVPSQGEIWILCRSLIGGGTEKACVILASELQANPWKIRLATLFGDPADDAFLLPPDVERFSATYDVGTTVTGKISRYFWAARQLRLEAKASQPQVVLAMGWPAAVVALLALSGTAIPVIVSERSDPRELQPIWPWRALRRTMYRSAEYLVVQTDQIAEQANRWIPSERIKIIENLVSPEAFQQIHEENQSERIVTVGRFVPEKGHDSLLRALQIVHRTFPNATLDLVGDGPECGRLSELARTLQLESSIRFHGFVKDPKTITLLCSIFVLPSKTEGFPNALLEAMASGMPCVATDCRSGGPARLVTSGTNGRIVPINEVNQMAEAITELLADPALRVSYGIAARERAAQNRPEFIIPLWNNLILEAINHRGSL